MSQQTERETYRAGLVEEFNQRIHALQSDTNNELLLAALDERPRNTATVVAALQHYDLAPFTRTQLFMLMSMKAELIEAMVIDSSFFEKAETICEASRLEDLYARILGVQKIEGVTYYDPEEIFWDMSKPIDDVTV